MALETSKACDAPDKDTVGVGEPERPFRPMRTVVEDTASLGVPEGTSKNVFGVETAHLGDRLLVDALQLSMDGNQVTEKDVKSLNHNLAIIHGIAPQDAIEALLATQMAAVHDATIRHAALMKSVKRIDQLVIQERTVNKLARTFAAQIEALRKHRTGGEQTMRIEHVTVNEGGQAIVGNVTQAGGKGTK